MKTREDIEARLQHIQDEIDHMENVEGVSISAVSFRQLEAQADILEWILGYHDDREAEHIIL